MKHRRSTFRRQWGWPIGLAVLTVFGLLSALIGEGGIWWWLSWAALAAPLLVIAPATRAAVPPGAESRGAAWGGRRRMSCTVQAFPEGDIRLGTRRKDGL